MKIRQAQTADRPAILEIHRQAFGNEKGPVISKLTDDLLEDKTAFPLFSLVADNGKKIVGHILFTSISLIGSSESPDAQILAPLAVLPESQNQGCGKLLAQAGLSALREAGVKLVFVLGHPGYYPRFGFSQAGKLGFDAPYPIPDEHSGAWMVQQLSGNYIGNISGRIQCAEVLNAPEHWRE